MKARFLGTLVLILSLTAGCSGGDQGGRILILGLDGLDPQTIDLLVSEGKMPSFARLRREGAYGRLLSSEPLLSPIIWTTIATGKEPNDHGIGHFVAINPETGDRLPVTSRLRRVKALWNIFSDRGKKVAVVGWWATWPAETVNGSIVSDHTAYHFLFHEGFEEGTETAGKTYPPELVDEIAPLVRRPHDIGLDDLAPYARVEAADLERPFDFDDDLGHLRWALGTAETYRDIGLELWESDDPDLAMVYIEGTDTVSHLFGHLFRTEGLAGELAEQQARYGRAVEGMYIFADQVVGKYLDALDDRTTLVVLSDHGFELGTLQDDPSRTRDMRRVSERFHRQQGILYMFGNQVRPGARLQGAKIVDIAPTVLALAGLPTAADMGGRVLTEGLLGDLRYLRSLQETRIASYEGGDAAVKTATAGDPAADEEIDRAALERLRSLGYLGNSSPKGDRVLAGLHFKNKRYTEAEKIYRRLLAGEPDDTSLLASLAGVLGAQGKTDEAKEALERAIALQPLNIEAYHNLAVILEREGRIDEAVKNYRAALRYRPDFEASRTALLRLTGSATTQQPRTPDEQRAGTITQEASQLARHGDYAGALEQLESAQQIAPQLPLIYHYRANVLFLMGDSAGARLALEQALRLEPDNAMFRENLKRLRPE